MSDEAEAETVVNVDEPPNWKPTIVEENSSTAIVQVANPYSLLQMALEKNLDAERIAQFMDLQDRMEKKAAEQQYAEAMNRCQKRMPVVVRDSQNKSTGSMYARLETVANLIRPIYTEEGFALEFGEDKSDLPNHRRIICEVQHTGGFSKTRFLDSPIDDVGAKGVANKTAVQGLGSMITYLRRYLTLMIFNIVVADEDNDGNSDSAKWTEDQCEQIRKMATDCERAGSPVREAAFIDWLAKASKANGEFRVYEDLPQSVFSKAVSELDKRFKKSMSDVGGGL